MNPPSTRHRAMGAHVFEVTVPPLVATSGVRHYVADAATVDGTGALVLTTAARGEVATLTDSQWRTCAEIRGNERIPFVGYRAA